MINDTWGKKEEIILFLKSVKKLLKELESIPFIEETSIDTGLDYTTINYYLSCINRTEGFIISSENSTDFLTRIINPEDLIISYDLLSLSEIKNKLHLNERDQKIFDLLFKEGMTLAKIAKIFNLSEPRISQIRSKFIKKLKTRYIKYLNDLAQSKDKLKNNFHELTKVK